MAPLALAAVWFGDPYFPLLVLLASIGMAHEWARLAGGERIAIRATIAATVAAAVIVLWLGVGFLALDIALMGAVMVWLVARLARAAAPLWLAAGTLWLTLPAMAMVWIADGRNGRYVIFFLLAVVWASDIGAYAAGRAIGGPRLAPALSPNKTWAGAVGGLAAAGLVGLAAALLAGLPMAAVMVAGLVLAVAAQLGDLAESLAKRHFGVKDSGNLIPGHGGLLDRLDSLLTASSVAALILLLGAGAGFGWHP